jgi:hypothetical protein
MECHQVGTQSSAIHLVDLTLESSEQHVVLPEEATVGEDGGMRCSHQCLHQASNAVQLGPGLHPRYGNVTREVTEATDFSRSDGAALWIST